MPELPLSKLELAALARLREHGPGAAVELDGDRRIALHRDLAARGWVRIDPSARCGFERVAGVFAVLTEAGRFALEVAERRRGETISSEIAHDPEGARA